MKQIITIVFVSMLCGTGARADAKPTDAEVTKLNNYRLTPVGS
jgi:hypothetical protein